MSATPFIVKRLTPDDLVLMDGMLEMFGRAFDDIQTYSASRPSAAYQTSLLAGNHFIALVAVKDDTVIGGIAAYELQKFEQERSEIYIYDLAVDSADRREGVATAMIEEIKVIAAERRAWVIYVQADRGDEAATALYTRMGVREDVLHFDIEVL